jgi:hypothetical protein
MSDGQGSCKLASGSANACCVLKLTCGIREALAEQVLAQCRYLLG